MGRDLDDVLAYVSSSIIALIGLKYPDYNYIFSFLSVVIMLLLFSYIHFSYKNKNDNKYIIFRGEDE